ncbi:hypothetical protein B0J13DRAFT_524566 [Dactylonectria estremocensis]|uniref:Enoyl reductase (ER) domain-containing protein n=1 Tax=Dactylonectria estremocensis TaxID=1079267 RepID=A0A9P9ETU9_9HYPO|nr:hypothetical protein B0J13DRAFT_524566 [Dactylonectria estremocensis]
MADQPREVIYLSTEGPEIRKITDKYQPQDSQFLVKVEYSGINPADIKHLTLGLHSSVAGYDLSGEVISAGPSSKFRAGDKVPLQRVTMVEAATLSVVTHTAADGLFNILGLAFPSAGFDGTEKQSLLIWGAGSAVGVSAVQLAKAAGHGPIFVTASAKHHPTLKALGADSCFDYHDEDVVEQVREAVRKSSKRLSHAFDTVGAGVFGPNEALEKSSPALVIRCAQGSVNDEGLEGKFVCVLPVRGDKRWKICAAVRSKDFTMFGAMESEDWPVRIKKAMNWVCDNYGAGKFQIPNVRVVQGISQAIEGMKWSAEGRSSLEKIVVKHPISGI